MGHLKHLARFWFEICRRLPELLIIQLLIFWDRLIFGKKILVIDAEEGSFLVHILPILENYPESEKISVFCARGEHVAIPLNKFRFRKSFNYRVARLLVGVDCYLAAQIQARGPRGALRIHMSHNQPVKYECHPKEDFTHFQVHFLTSPLHKIQVERSLFRYNWPEQNVRLYEVGYCKFDELARARPDRTNVFSKFGLSLEKKTLIYAPSWEEGLSLREFGENLFAELERLMTEYNIIIKPHPVSLTPESAKNFEFYTGGYNWSGLMRQLQQRGFFFFEGEEYKDIFVLADLLITDHSSVALEFMMLDKPCLFIHCERYYTESIPKLYAKFGQTTREACLNDLALNGGRTLGVICDSILRLSEDINRALADEPQVKFMREQAMPKLFYNRGHSAKVAGQVLRGLLNEK